MSDEANDVRAQEVFTSLQDKKVMKKLKLCELRQCVEWAWASSAVRAPSDACVWFDACRWHPNRPQSLGQNTFCRGRILDINMATMSGVPAMSL